MHISVMRKRAVLIGCNYPGTKGELRGCINDVRRMQRCLLDRYAFPPENITVLIDTEAADSHTQPTGRNIRAALSDLVSSAEAGDVLFVHYSGHGTRLPSEADDEDDDTGYDECIVPTDMNLITDDDFRELVNKVVDGCRITIVSDSCHSGGLIELAKEQIGESTTRNKGHANGKCFGFNKFSCKSADDAIAIDQSGNVGQQSRSLPLSTLVEILKQKSGKHNIDADKLRPTLFEMFGKDASPKIKRFMKAIMSKLPQPRPLSDCGILISGCQSDQTSGDTYNEGEPDLAYGNLSSAIQDIIAETNGKVTNRKLVLRARKLLKREGFAQRPGLYCSDQYVHAPFIC